MKAAKPADTKPSKLGTPYIEVTPAPAAEGEEVAAAAVQPKPRRLANLVTSWGPGVSKLRKLASGQGGATTAATLPAKTRTSPRVPPSLPPKSDYVVQKQQSGELSFDDISIVHNYILYSFSELFLTRMTYV